MEAIPHCIGHLFTSAKYDKLKAGPDNVCLLQDLDIEVHSVESLRCLLIAHLFVFQKLLWDDDLKAKTKGNKRSCAHIKILESETHNANPVTLE